MRSPPVGEVLGFDFALAANHLSNFREVFVHKGSSVEQMNSCFLDLVRDGPEYGLGVASIQSRQQANRLEVGVQPAEQFPGVTCPAITA